MIECWFDGGCEPRNPGGVGVYGIIGYRGDDVLFHEAREVGRGELMSNNVAEYSGLIAILEKLIELGLQDEPVQVFGDSNLVIQQMFGSWRIKSGLYTDYAYRCRELVGKFRKLHGHWVPREDNTAADALCRGEFKRLGVKSTDWQLKKTLNT